MQSKKNSLFEALTSTITGIVINALLTPIVNKVCQIEMSHRQILFSTLIFTIISITRSYIIRRWFTRIKN